MSTTEKPPANKWPWQKDHTAFLVMNYRKMRILEIAKHIGCTRQVLYNKIAALGLSRKFHPADKQRERVQKFLQTMSDMKAAADATPWPRVTTTMKDALQGRGFGGNTVAAGTKRPKRVHTDWTGGLGEPKSSMG